MNPQVDIDFLTKEFLRKAELKFGNTFDYSLIKYSNCYTKIKIICKKHGEFEVSPQSHLNSKFGCFKCCCEISSKSRTLSQDIFIKRASKIHNNKYNYSKCNYINNETKIIITCPIHGDFLQKPNNHLFGKGCKKCANIANRKRFQMNKDKFVQLANSKHKNKFDYSLVDYINCDTNIEIICPKHGKFTQTPYHHLRAPHGCPKCWKKVKGMTLRKDDEYYLDLLTKKFGNEIKYKIVRNRCNRLQISVNCPKHGIYITDFRNVLYSTTGCKKCSISESKQEINLEKFLNFNFIKHIRNTRKVIKPLELDLYIKQKKLAIEYNGIYWHSELFEKNRNYHLNKTSLCEKKNIRLIHIFENEMVLKPKIVFSRLKTILGIKKRHIYARKCRIFEIDNPIKNKFLNKYHLQGGDKSSIKLGLYYKNRLVAVMTFGKLRKALGRQSKDGAYELIRYATLANFNIIGGAGKLLKHFERNYNPEFLISYADRRWSSGDLYKKLGFTHSHNSNPNYWYFAKEDLYILHHRFNFRKNVLSKKLKNFNPNLSEWENMKANGWSRIWDCGNMVFIKNY